MHIDDGRSEREEKGADLLRTLAPAAGPARGTILEWVEQLERKSADAKAQSRPASRPRRTEPARAAAVSSRRRFVLEFEATGDVRIACDAAECTIYDVRHWRATDPGFQRDFALAAQAYVRELRRRVEFVADDSEHHDSHAARQLLASQAEYVGADSRLDVRRWRDALLAFLQQVGIDPGESALPDTQ